MKITLDKKEYELNIARAIELGIAKEVVLPYEPKAGDILNSQQNGRGFNIVLIQDNKGKFLLGNCSGGNPFTLFVDQPRTAEEIRNTFTGNWKYVGNCNILLPPNGKNKPILG